jgi:transcriptional regulator with XRE-family HTH domain
MTFGERFKALRIEKGLKQQELADDFNKIYGHTFAKSSISQYENNKRSPEIKALKDFASYFDVSIDYLLGVSNFRFINTDLSKLNLQDQAFYYVNNFFMDSSVNKTEKDKFTKKIVNLYFDCLK